MCALGHILDNIERRAAYDEVGGATATASDFEGHHHT